MPDILAQDADTVTIAGSNGEPMAIPRSIAQQQGIIPPEQSEAAPVSSPAPAAPGPAPAPTEPPFDPMSHPLFHPHLPGNDAPGYGDDGSGWHGPTVSGAVSKVGAWLDRQGAKQMERQGIAPADPNSGAQDPNSGAPPPGIAAPPPAAPQGPPLEGAGPAAPKARPITPQQQQGLNAVGQKVTDMLSTGEGKISQQIIDNDIAVLGLDDQHKKIILQNLKDMETHITAVREAGVKMAHDAAGGDYWDNASTGMKILRVIGGVLTIGASEKGIRASIDRQVAIDQKSLDSENNVYALMLQKGKTKEEALAIDQATQSHRFILGMDRLSAQYPKLQEKIGMLKGGVQREQTEFAMKYYQQQQQNKVAQQNANTESFNAQTSRKAEQFNETKPTPGALEAKKYLGETTYKTLDGKIQQAATADEAKAINKTTNAFHTVERLGTQIVGALTLGHSWGGENKVKIDNAINGLNAALASMEDGGLKISARNQAVIDRLKGIQDHTGFDTTRASEVKTLIESLRADIAQSYSQATR